MADTQILLVQSHDRMRGLMAKHLKSLGYAVDECVDGVAAVRRLSEAIPDVLVIDQDVPLGGTRTAKLLRLHRRYGQIPALVLVNGQDSTEGAVASGPASRDLRFLAKPCQSEALRESITACLETPLEPLKVDDVRQEISSLARLPVLSPAHRKILALLACEDESVDVPEVVRTIEADVGLTTSILRVCNSAYYGFRGNSVDLAITFLGVDKIRSIVQAAIVFDVFASDVRAKSEGFNVLELWRHCVACGVVMVEGGTRVKGRDHFIAGMLHDIGKMILHLRFPDHFAEILRLTDQEGWSFRDAEEETLGLGHAEIGYELARKWAMPPTIATCIRFHHHPGRALQHRRLSALVHVADIAVRMLEIGSGGDDVLPTMDPVAKPLARQVLAVLDRKDQIAQEVESMVAEYCMDRSKPVQEEAVES